MAFLLNQDVIGLIKNLIQTVSGFKDGEDNFKHLEDNITTQIRNSQSIFFTKEKDLESIIDSLCNKFMFHGFAIQGRDLKRIYQKFIPENLSKQELRHRLNVVKFLLDVSESPTNNIHKYPQTFDRGDYEEEINWHEYLYEDIPRWSPPPDEESDCWSEKSSEVGSGTEVENVTELGSKLDSTCGLQQADNSDCFLMYHNSKANLFETVQSKWFLTDRLHRPVSSDKDANVAFIWEDFIQQSTKGLIPIQASNIISEYKIMREIIWQLYEPHSSSCFQFMGNILVPKLNVTISSVRMKVFETFLYEFVPYINWLQTLREFHESLIKKYEDIVVPDTYRGYDYALQTIIRPIFDEIQVIENKIRKQETTSTLLSLAHEIKPLFQIIQKLKDIHCNVVLDFKQNSPLVCTTTLLCRLHKGILYASSKLEQDLYLTLYLHSLYKYFTIINSWLSRDLLDDYTEEFVIVDENPKEPHVLFNNYTFVAAKSLNQSVCVNNRRKVQQGEQDWQMEFFVKNLEDNIKSDTIITLICTQVLQIGKNIHLLRLLGKLHQVPEFTGMFKGSLYEAYIEKVLENISEYFGSKPHMNEMFKEIKAEVPSTPTFVFPATCPDECKYLTEMDRLENLVDTSNGFLVKAFESFFVKKPEVKPEESEEILFERVKKRTKNLFPVQQIIEHAFVEVLKERYSTSGLMVKNVLLEEYNLEKQFSFLKNVFLFSEDFIFPLYRRIFQQFDSKGIWGNHTWLTSHLQDIVMDAYPIFYKECTVYVKDTWKLCTDPLKACRMINIHYRIHWPVNIIIRDEHMEMYKDLFQFILKIKWALFTLNHLYFTDLEPKGKPAKSQNKSLRKLISKLKTLRFGLINLCSSIQHYILGHIFSKLSSKFDKALKEAYDLESLRNAHENFVQAFHKTCLEFQEYNSSSYGFDLLLYLVRKLRIMWKNLRDINDDELEKCEKSYLLCHKHIDPIINPSAYSTYVSND